MHYHIKRELINAVHISSSWHSLIMPSMLLIASIFIGARLWKMLSQYLPVTEVDVLNLALSVNVIVALKCFDFLRCQVDIEIDCGHFHEERWARCTAC